MTLSITTLSTTSLRITTLNITDSQHNDTQHNRYQVASAVRLSIVMLSVANFIVKLSIIMLSVVMLSVVMLSVVAPNRHLVICRSSARVQSGREERADKKLLECNRLWKSALCMVILEPIEGSSEKMNRLKIPDKKMNRRIRNGAQLLKL
jgi:hypothetical protein